MEKGPEVTCNTPLRQAVEEVRSLQVQSGTLEDLGLFVRITGVVDDYDSAITASSQSIEAGTKVERGTVVEVHFVSSVIDYDYT